MQLRARRTDGFCWEWCFLCGTMYLLGCYLLAGCDDQLTKIGINFCRWKFFNNTRVIGGYPQLGVATVSVCQSICEASATCKGFDFSASNTPNYQCFLLMTQDGKQPADNVLHYDKGYCADCLWNPTNNFKVGGGMVNPAAYLDTCQNACLFTDKCEGIDWVIDGPQGQQCYLVSSRDSKIPASGVVHFDFFCNTGCQWAQLVDQQIIGGTMNPATSIIACQNACVPWFGCRGIDWTDRQAPGQKCNLLFTHDGLSHAPGVNHFDLVCSTDCQWRRMDGWQIIGGTVNSAPDIITCLNLCLTFNECYGVDWAFYQAPGKRCYLQPKYEGKSRAPGVTHFDLICNADCQWRRMDGWQIDGGTGNPAPDIATCQNVCLATQNCKGIDWAVNRDPEERCWLLFQYDGKISEPDVTHFDLLCSTGRRLTWPDDISRKL